jgi:hypothetical protein
MIWYGRKEKRTTWLILNENNFNNKYFKLSLMNRPDPNKDKMSPEISVLIRKNSHELITYYIPSAKFFIGIFFANERKHP